MDAVRFVAIVLFSLAAYLPAFSQSDDRQLRATLTEKDCRDFAERLIGALKAGDLDACHKFYDMDGVVDRLFEGLEFRFSDKEIERAKWKKLFANSHAYYQPLVDALREGGSVEVVSIHPEKPKGHVVIRVIFLSGGFNYHILSFARNKSESLIVSDVDAFSAGESPMDAVLTTLAHFTPTDGPDGKTHPDAPEAETIIMDKRLLRGMQEQFVKRDYENVWYFYSRLSSGLQNEKYPMLMAALSLNNVETESNTRNDEIRNKLVQSLIERYRKKYPGDSGLDVILVEYYINSRQFDLAIDTINSIEKNVGGDPGLDLFRAGIYLQAGNLEAARKSADAAVAALPTVPLSYAMAAEVAVQQRDDQQAVKILEQLSARFDHKISAKRKSDPAWARFLESEAYKGWQSEKKKPTKVP